MIVTRKAIQTPSNSKSPGNTRHVDIGGRPFAATKDQIGTGVASADVPEGMTTISIGAGFITGKNKKLERREATIQVMVTGNQDDTVSLSVSLAQTFEIQFWGVRLISDSPTPIV